MVRAKHTAILLITLALLSQLALAMSCADPAEEFIDTLEQQGDAYERLIQEREEESIRQLNGSLRTLLALEATPDRSRDDLVSLCLKLGDSFARTGDGVRGIQIDMLPNNGEATRTAPGKGLVAVWHAPGEKRQWKVLQDGPDQVKIPEAARAEWEEHESNWSFQSDTEDRHLRVRFYVDRSRLRRALEHIQSRYQPQRDDEV